MYLLDTFCCFLKITLEKHLKEEEFLLFFLFLVYTSGARDHCSRECIAVDGSSHDLRIS